MPFPSPQGTQAAIAAMLRAHAEAGRAAELLTYAHGAPDLDPLPEAIVHRRIARSFGDRSLRSGPSLAKLAQDVELARVLVRSPASLVIAHHVEACAAAWLAARIAHRRTPLVFIAHTALGPELPTYLERPTAGATAALRLAGETIDRLAIAAAGSLLAISPLLADHIRQRTGRCARFLPTPWPVPAPIDDLERERARASLAIAPDAEVVLYAGNLDRYQGLSHWLGALARLAPARSRLRALIATASDPGPLSREAAAIGVRDRISFVPIEGEAQRRLVHAAASLVAIPRAAPGGLPIKLLEALARGVPVIAARRACAGLALESVVSICEDDHPGALADAITDQLTRPRPAEQGRQWVTRELSTSRFLDALDQACAEARAAVDAPTSPASERTEQRTP